MTMDSGKGFTGVILNLTGCRPGEAFDYDGPTMTSQMRFIVTVEPTYEAIEKFILPPPLKADRDLPPRMRVIYFVNRHCRGFDGRLTPYRAVAFWADAQFGDHRGKAGWEYVDALHGDKTDMDIMGPWGVYFGMLKKMADINFLPVTADEFEISVNRRGTRLVSMRIKVGRECSEEEILAINENVSGTLTVREIPDVTYSKLVERTVCWSPTHKNKVDRAWHGDGGSIEFGGLPLDPLDKVPVIAVCQTLCTLGDTRQETFTAADVIEALHDD